jgi:hypothetical protein
MSISGTIVSLGAVMGGIIAAVILTAFLIWFTKVGYAWRRSDGVRWLAKDYRPEVLAAIFGIIIAVIIEYSSVPLGIVAPYSYGVIAIGGIGGGYVSYTLIDIHYRRYIGMDEVTDEVPEPRMTAEDILANRKDDTKEFLIWSLISVALVVVVGTSFFIWFPLGGLAPYRSVLTVLVALTLGLGIAKLTFTIWDNHMLKRNAMEDAVTAQMETNAMGAGAERLVNARLNSPEMAIKIATRSYELSDDEIWRYARTPNGRAQLQKYYLGNPDAELRCSTIAPNWLDA